MTKVGVLHWNIHSIYPLRGRGFQTSVVFHTRVSVLYELHVGYDETRQGVSMLRFG